MATLQSSSHPCHSCGIEQKLGNKIRSRLWLATSEHLALTLQVCLDKKFLWVWGAISVITPSLCPSPHHSHTICPSHIAHRARVPIYISPRVRYLDMSLKEVFFLLLSQLNLDLHHRTDIVWHDMIFICIKICYSKDKVKLKPGAHLQSGLIPFQSPK